MSISSIEAKLDMVRVLRTKCGTDIRRVEEELSRLEAKKAHLRDAQRLCDFCLQEQTDIRGPLEETVTAFLEVLDDDLKFYYETSYKTDKVTISGLTPVFLCGGEDNRPSEGQKTVASSSLHLTVLKLHDELCQTIIFDEYFADVNPAVMPQLIQLISQLGVQVILVTHQQVEAPYALEVVKTGKISRVHKL